MKVDRREADENTPLADITSDGFVLDESDEGASIPDAPDGFVYYLAAGGGEFHSVEAAKRWADARPWDAVVWNER
jgi:hypothetical protein